MIIPINIFAISGRLATTSRKNIFLCFKCVIYITLHYTHVILDYNLVCN